MAILEPKLLPLIETLAEVGADWLAFEVIDGIRAGKLAEEHLENLAAIQDAVRSAKLENFRGGEKRVNAVPPSVPPQVPIIGDEQIRWAAEYIHKRLSDALSMLQSSLDQLQRIVSTPEPRDGVSPDIVAGNEITLILQGDEQKFSVRKAEITNAIAALENLRKALSSWEASTREGRQRE
jgi:hypothetical protein